MASYLYTSFSDIYSEVLDSLSLIIWFRNCHWPNNKIDVALFPESCSQSWAVPRYFFSTVIGTVDTFKKIYRFWYRRYFLDRFTRYFGNFF